MRQKIALGVMGTMALISAACSNNQDAFHGLTAEDAAKLQAQHNADPGPNGTVNANTRFAAGQLAEAEGKPELAIYEYNEAIKLEPKQLGSLYRLGVVQTQIKKFPEAIDAWKKYIDATNDSALGYNNLAFTYELSGDSLAAEEQYRLGIQREPKNVPCRVDYGLLLARHGRINEAVVQWQVILTPAEIHYNLGSVYELEGRKGEARAEYNQAIALDPKFHDAQQRVAALDNE